MTNIDSVDSSLVPEVTETNLEFKITGFTDPTWTNWTDGANSMVVEYIGTKSYSGIDASQQELFSKTATLNF